MPIQVDLVELLRRVARRTPNRTEADVQSDIQSLLLFGGLNLDDPQVRLESPAPGQRRIDVEIGRSVIEIKKDLSVGNVRTEAIEQLAGYVRDRTATFDQRYTGILTDGHVWELFHLDQSADELRAVSTLEINPDSPDPERVIAWLEAVLNTAEQLVPTPHEVERKLGADSPGFRLDLAELQSVYERCRNVPEIQLKRELWARLLASAFGTNFEDHDQLFIEHTYLVLSAEIIAHRVMGIDLVSGSVDAAALVGGAVFHEAGIGGVVDADFFDWPTSSDDGVRLVNGMTRRFSRFDWTVVEHDVLKVLYESVIDAETRHSLGEYYTPDWLAEHTVEQVVDDPLRQRVLDPACGSGTFLFWAIRRYLTAADAAGISNSDALDGLTQHVFGIDLHPVAVTLARVTYLLAIGADRLQDRGELTIPVYLGNSIQLGHSTSVLTPSGITVHTTDGAELFAQELRFPESIVSDGANFDRLIERLAAKAQDRPRGSRVPGIREEMKRHGVAPSDYEEIERSFQILCSLHDQHRNHIWGYYIRNLARPLEFTRGDSRMDRLVGNPPWLRYNAMHSQTQADFRTVAMDLGVWSKANLVTSQDLSATFVVRCTQLYLADNGQFGFVMPAAALSRGQYAGFRAASYPSASHQIGIRFSTPWEISGIDPDPFPVPGCVVFGTLVGREDSVDMPIVARWLGGRITHNHRRWGEVEGLITETYREVVVASDDYLSPYGALFRQGANLVPRVLLTTTQQATTALGGLAGRTSVISDRSSPEKPPWRDLPSLTGNIENQFLHPVYLGESLLPFRVRRGRTAVGPWDGEKLLSSNMPSLDAYPGLASWWRQAEQVFLTYRSASTKYDLNDQIDHMGKLASQFPLAPHRVVYTGRGAIITAARVEEAEAVVDHALYWSTCASIEEARYLCAVLNSAHLQSMVEEALSKGLFGGRNIHRAPFRLAWGEYEPENEIHRQLAACGEHGELVAAQVDVGTRGTSKARSTVRDALRDDGVAATIDTLVTELLAV
jgi:SAM-dependent methyltransferase